MPSRSAEWRMFQAPEEFKEAARIWARLHKGGKDRAYEYLRSQPHISERQVAHFTAWISRQGEAIKAERVRQINAERHNRSKLLRALRHTERLTRYERRFMERDES